MKVSKIPEQYGDSCYMFDISSRTNAIQTIFITQLCIMMFQSFVLYVYHNITKLAYVYVYSTEKVGILNMHPLMCLQNIDGI